MFLLNFKGFIKSFTNKKVKNMLHVVIKKNAILGKELEQT